MDVFEEAQGQHSALPRCCDRHGLNWPDGPRHCVRHATEEERALLDELDERGRAAGISVGKIVPEPGNRIAWPYGPNVDVGTRIRMLDWAEEHGLRLAQPRHRCLNWIRKGRCNGSGCYGSQPRWMDHVTTWTRHGEPAVFVAQPYNLSEFDTEVLALLSEDPDLYVEIRGDAWYSEAAIFIGVWNDAAHWAYLEEHEAQLEVAS
jgi:hypothetical protein